MVPTLDMFGHCCYSWCHKDKTKSPTGKQPGGAKTTRKRLEIMTDTTFTSVGEAIAFITDAIEDATGVADARSEYDIYAIADKVIGAHSDRTHDGTTISTSEYFSIDADEDDFYDAILGNKLVGIAA